MVSETFESYSPKPPNAGQTMNISIGSMASSVLGVATSNSASVASSSTLSTSTQTVTTGGATATGAEDHGGDRVWPFAPGVSRLPKGRGHVLPAGFAAWPPTMA